MQRSNTNLFDYVPDPNLEIEKHPVQSNQAITPHDHSISNLSSQGTIKTVQSKLCGQTKKFASMHSGNLPLCFFM